MADEGTPIDTEMDMQMGEDQNNPVSIDDNEDDIPEDDTQIPATQDDTINTSSPAINPQTVFLDYLRSPIVQLEIGTGDEQTTISAHRSILTRSPYFADALSSPDTTVVSLPDDDIDAIACFLQYQYTGEYFPRRLPNTNDGLETDPSLPSIDTTGAQLLKHARVYTLAEKLGLPELKTLAHSKIHRINSTAIGEIAYARYVYGHTSAVDATIRRPVAAFWATRSHVLRHEAEQEFRAMCLEFPQFGFDVLSLVLDAREKRARDREEVTETGTPQTAGKGRKRMRPSVNI